MTVRLSLPRVLRRLWRYLCTTPVVEAIDPTPEYWASVERAKEANAAELREHYRQLDETPCYRGLSEIMRVHQAEVVDLAARKKALLAKSLTEECGALTGPAWTFERREK